MGDPGNLRAHPDLQALPVSAKYFPQIHNEENLNKEEINEEEINEEEIKKEDIKTEILSKQLDK